MGEKTVDMTKGSILPKMIRFALPVLLGMLFQILVRSKAGLSFEVTIKGIAGKVNARR